MPNRKIITASSAAVALLLAGGVAVATTASGAAAAIPAPTAGNMTVLSAPPRLVKAPGTAFAAKQITTYTVAGKTYSGITIPANTTGVVLSITVSSAQANGSVTAWTAEGGQPGTPTVTYTKGVSATNLAFVGLNSAGAFNVASSAAANVLIAVQSYVTPLAATPAPVVKSIPAKDATVLEQVGGSIRGDKANNLKGATPFGSVVLSAGTWDARVIGGFTGLNNGNKACTTGDNFLTGTMVLVKGDGSTDPNRNFDFNQVAATAGGVIVPESDSATLTQDPTVQANTFITLTEDTKVTVSLFGYASNSSTDCTGTLKGNLQSAQFLKVA